MVQIDRKEGKRKEKGRIVSTSASSELEGTDEFEENEPVVTWGDKDSGGDSSSVDFVSGGGVLQVLPASKAFAAILNDKSVVTWGNPKAGGDSSGIDFSSGGGVKTIVAAKGFMGGFTALKNDGSTVTWGTAVTEDNKVVTQVEQLVSTADCFAALRTDGSVETWGAQTCAGAMTGIDFTSGGGVKSLNASVLDFVAVKYDGSCVSWGYTMTNCPTFSPASGGIKKLFLANQRFIAVLNDDSVESWGRENTGKNISQVDFSRDGGLKELFANRGAFAALMGNGNVQTWGRLDVGGDSQGVDFVSGGGVVTIQSNRCAFAALKKNGSVVFWGNVECGGKTHSSWHITNPTGDLSKDVVSLYSTTQAFAALKKDGSVVTWGHIMFGGIQFDMMLGVRGSLGWFPMDLGSRGGVKEIYSTESAFAAVKKSGSIITWGSVDGGGLSNGKDFQFKDGLKTIYSNQAAFVAVGNMNVKPKDPCKAIDFDESLSTRDKRRNCLRERRDDDGKKVSRHGKKHCRFKRGSCTLHQAFEHLYK